VYKEKKINSKTKKKHRNYKYEGKNASTGGRDSSHHSPHTSAENIPHFINGVLLCAIEAMSGVIRPLDRPEEGVS